MHGSIKGINKFRELRATLQEAQSDRLKMFAVATDGCPYMLGANEEPINK